MVSLDWGRVPGDSYIHGSSSFGAKEHDLRHGYHSSNKQNYLVQPRDIGGGDLGSCEPKRISMLCSDQ